MTSTYAASAAYGPRDYTGDHRDRALTSWQRIVAVLSTFILAAVSISGGLIMLIDAGVPVGTYWAPLSLVTLGGACYTAMIAAALSRDL